MKKIPNHDICLTYSLFALVEGLLILAINCLDIVDFFPQLAQRILVFFYLYFSFFFVFLKCLFDGEEFCGELLVGISQKAALFLQGLNVIVGAGLVEIEISHYYRSASRRKQRVIGGMKILDTLIGAERNVFDSNYLFDPESTGP